MRLAAEIIAGRGIPALNISLKSTLPRSCGGDFGCIRTRRPRRQSCLSALDEQQQEHPDDIVNNINRMIEADLRELKEGPAQWKSGIQTETVSPAVEREQRTLAQEIKVMGRSGRWREVLSIVDTAKNQGTILNVVIYSCAISAVAQSGKWQEAMELLEDMREEGIEPDRYSYNPAITACANASQWARALSLLQEMREGRGPDPDIISYNAAITACARGGEPERALGLLQEMDEITPGKRGVGGGVRPNQISFNAAINACAKAGWWEEALSLLQEMKQRDVAPSLVSYNSAIDACAKGGRWEEALAVRAMMSNGTGELNGKPDRASLAPSPDVVTFNCCIDACRRGGAPG
ncbi:unnamed protein product, partial [Discosporangium mesarthrocarpum]